MSSTREVCAAPRVERRQGVLARCSLLVGLAVMLSTIGLVVASYTPLPFWDQWDNLVDHSDVSWAWLLRQHNEHRILMARLLSLADDRISQSAYVLPTVGLVVMPIATAALFVRLARNYGPQLALPWIAGVTLGGLFSAMQHDNFTWAFQLPFFALSALVVATLSVLVLAPPTLPALLAVIGLEAIALYTLSSGAVLLVLTVAVAVWIRRPRGEVAVLTLAAVGLLGSYLAGYTTPPDHASPTVAVFHLGTIGLYCLALLGHPAAALIPIGGPIPAVLLGALGLGRFAVWNTRLWQERDSPIPQEIVFAAVAWFVLGTTVLTGFGRWHFGVGQALTSRYTTPALMFWLVLLVQAAASTKSDIEQSRVMTLGLVALVALLLNQPRYVAAGVREAASRQVAAAALLAGVGDQELLRRIYPEPDDVLAQRDTLRSQQASVFGPDWARWLDRPFEMPPGWPLPACTGTFDQATRVTAWDHPGWRTNGRLLRPLPPKTSNRIVLVDGKQIVRGFGFSGLSDRAAMMGHGQTRSDAWLGEAEDAEPTTLTAYALRTDGLPACRFGPSQHVIR